MSNNFFDTYLAYAKKRIVIKQADYIHNNLLFCGDCKMPKECKITHLGKTEIVPCPCNCDDILFKKNKRAEKEESNRMRVLQIKTLPLQHKFLYDNTFENDNGNTPHVIKIAKNYINDWHIMESSSLGLLLWGDVGVGKTYACACICNELLNRGIPVLMTSFSKIINELQGFKIENKNQFISDLCKFKLILFDDLGTERTTESAHQIVFDVIDTLTLAAIPLLFTTNLTIDDIKNESRITHSRIYDRVLGASVPFKITGKSQREIESKIKLELAKKLLK